MEKNCSLPELAKLTKSLTAISASSVPGKRVFSDGGAIFRPRQKKRVLPPYEADFFKNAMSIVIFFNVYVCLFTYVCKVAFSCIF